MTFQQDKKKQLEMQDNSSIGSWDKHILALCNKINKKKEYYTTSSCAGRIVIIKASETKKPGLFIFRSHEKVTFAKLKKELKKCKIDANFKQEPCILHVACFDLMAAQKLIDRAKLAGWKNSGIMASRDRIVCEMRSTEFIQFPIVKKGKILVNDGFLKIIVKEANSKLERTWDKIKRLESLI